MVVIACNPCPCGDYHPTPGQQQLQLPRAAAARLPLARSPARSPTGSTSSATSCRSAPRRGRTPSSAPESSADVRARVERPRAPAGGPLRRTQLAAQRAGAGPAPPRASGRWPADAQRAARRRALRRPAHPPRRHPRAPAGLDGRRPRGRRPPGLAELDAALRLRSGEPLLAAACVGAARRMSAPDDERLARVALGRLAEPGDPRLAALVAELGAVRRPRRTSPPSATSAACSPTSPPGSARSTRAATSTAPSGSASGSWSPATTEWPRQVDDLAAARRSRTAADVPLGLWVRGPLRLDELDGVGRRRRARARPRPTAPTWRRASPPALAARRRHAWSPAPRSASTRPPTAARWPPAADGRRARLRRRPRLPGGPQAAARPPRRPTGPSCPSSPPGCAPTRIRFLARNRLIAALTRGTVVVEAAVRSGALNTANWADRLSRPLMGVPGPVTSAPSQGVHQLIRRRRRHPGHPGAEVLELVGPAGDHLLEPPARPRRAPATGCPDVTAGARRRAGAPTASAADSIARTAGMGLLEVRSALTPAATPAAWSSGRRSRLAARPQVGATA